MFDRRIDGRNLVRPVERQQMIEAHVEQLHREEHVRDVLKKISALKVS